MEKRQRTNAIDYLDGYQDGYKKGIGEVVEWVGGMLEPYHNDHPFNIDPNKDTRWYVDFHILAEVWNDKLKEWGVK